MSGIIQELQSLGCTFSMIKVELRRFRKQILGGMSEAAFDREKFALQRVLDELLPNLHIGLKSVIANLVKNCHLPLHVSLVLGLEKCRNL